MISVVRVRRHPRGADGEHGPQGRPVARVPRRGREPRRSSLLEPAEVPTPGQSRELRRELVAQLDRRSDLGLGHDVAALAVRQHDAQNARSVPSRNSRQCSARAPHPHCLAGAAVSRVARPSYRRMFASTDRLRPFTLAPFPPIPPHRESRDSAKPGPRLRRSSVGVHARRFPSM